MVTSSKCREKNKIKLNLLMSITQNKYKNVTKKKKKIPNSFQVIYKPIIVWRRLRSEIRIGTSFFLNINKLRLFYCLLQFGFLVCGGHFNLLFLKKKSILVFNNSMD